MCDWWVAFCRTQSCRNLHCFFTEGPRSLGTNSTSTIHNSCAASCGPSLGKMQVKVPHQRSLYALKFEDRSQEETERKERCARGDAWRLSRNILKLTEEYKATFFLTYQRMVSPSAIHNKTGGKRVCGRFQSINAHVEQDRKGLYKSNDGCSSQRRSANKRRGNNVCQRIGFILDSNASRRYTSSSSIRKTLRRSRIFPPLDQWSETTTHQKRQTNKMQHGEIRTLRCPLSIDKFFNFIFTTSGLTRSIQQQREVRLQVRKYRETCRME